MDKWDAIRPARRVTPKLLLDSQRWLWWLIGTNRRSNTKKVGYWEAVQKAASQSNSGFLNKNLRAKLLIFILFSMKLASTTIFANFETECRSSQRNSMVKAKHSFFKATQRNRIKEMFWSDPAYCLEHGNSRVHQLPTDGLAIDPTQSTVVSKPCRIWILSYRCSTYKFSSDSSGNAVEVLRGFSSLTLTV